MECVWLADAFALRDAIEIEAAVAHSKSGSKLPALQTLARDSFAYRTKSREAFGVRPACRRFWVACDCWTLKSGSKLHALQTLARNLTGRRTNGAKRLECARLAGAFTPGASAGRTFKSGSKLHALQTLTRSTRNFRFSRSVWSASGLPTLSHCVRLLDVQKREQAPRTPNAGAPFVRPHTNRPRCSSFLLPPPSSP